MSKSVEYRVKPVTRFIITRHEIDGNASSTQQIGGEHDGPEVAHGIGYALARAEHERFGYPVGDERIKYPEMPA